MSDAESVKIAHLTMIHSVIARMATNSFTLKTLSISFIGAWIAFMAATSEFSIFYLLAPLLPTLMFWMLDAQYLKLERAYRKLYEGVRSGSGVEAYSMDFTPFSKEVGGLFRVACSWSILIYYGVLVFLTVGVGFFLMCGEPSA